VPSSSVSGLAKVTCIRRDNTKSLFLPECYSFESEVDILYRDPETFEISSPSPSLPFRDILIYSKTLPIRPGLFRTPCVCNLNAM